MEWVRRGEERRRKDRRTGKQPEDLSVISDHRGIIA
jgi:hypothetical protein